MATSKDYFEYVYENLKRAGDVSARPMMGEYIIYYKGKVIGNICDNCLFIKQTKSSIEMLGDCEMTYPYQGSKTIMYIMDNFEDENFVKELFEAMYDELPCVVRKKK